MTLWWMPEDTAAFGARPIDLDRNPCPTVMAGGINGRGMTQYWLVKSEPKKYAFSDLVRDGKTVWDGVRNNQAAIYLPVACDDAIPWNFLISQSKVG